MRDCNNTSATSQLSIKKTWPSNSLMLALKLGLSSNASSKVMLATGIIAATPSAAVGPGGTEARLAGTTGIMTE